MRVFLGTLLDIQRNVMSLRYVRGRSPTVTNCKRQES